MDPQSVVTMESSLVHLYVLACAHPNLDGLCADVRAGFTLGGPILAACTLFNALYIADLRGHPRRIAEQTCQKTCRDLPAASNAGPLP